MPNILILFWGPGSGGDFVQSMLLSDQIRYGGVVDCFTRSNDGRVRATIHPAYKEMFVHEPLQWYARTWTIEDCNKLSNYIKNLSIDTFIIPTHSLDQCVFLKKHFANSISVGITYTKNMFPVVLKNYIKKVTPTNPDIDEIYNQPFHQYLKKNNVFNEFVLKEQLKFSHALEPIINDQFDINISLEELYVANSSIFKSLVNDTIAVGVKINEWLSLQDVIPQYSYKVHPTLKNALGYNSKATHSGDINLELDLYDNILLKEFCLANKLSSKIPNFKKLKDADEFFNAMDRL